MDPTKQTGQEQAPHGDQTQIKKEPAHDWGFFTPQPGGLHENAVPQQPPRKQQKQMRIVKNFTDGVHQFLMQSFGPSIDGAVSERFTKFALLHGPDRALRALLRQDELWVQGDITDMEELHFWSEDQNMDETMQVLRYDYMEKVKPVVELIDLTGLYEPADKPGDKPASADIPVDVGDPDGSVADSIPDEFTKFFTTSGMTAKQFFSELRKKLGVRTDPLPTPTTDKTNPALQLYPSLQGLGDFTGPVMPPHKGILKSTQNPANQDICKTPGACGPPAPSIPSAQTGPDKMVYEIRYIAPGEWEYTGRIIPLSKQKTEPVFSTPQPAILPR